MTVALAPRGPQVASACIARDALNSKRLYVVYQPIVDLRTGEVFAHEALARCEEPRVDPPALFDAAISSGCCGELGRALRQLAIDGCTTHPLFLNVHPHELDERWIVRPDDPLFFHERKVFLEVTEAVPLSHYKVCESVLRELRGKGVSLAVDDLGAGFSNLKYIADLAPEIVKLDRELVRNLHEHERLFRLVSGLVRLCEDLGARVVAEGIETREELRAVIDAGARYGQGYVLARPARHPPEVASFDDMLPLGRRSRRAAIVT